MMSVNRLCAFLVLLFTFVAAGSYLSSETNKGESTAKQLFQAPDNQQIAVINWGAKYKYKEVAHWAITTFQKTSYSDAAWASKYAGFGVRDARCSLNNCCVYSYWGGYDDMLLRKWFFVSSGSGGYTVNVAVDNGAQVFINGYDISNGMKSRTGCPARSNFAFAVPRSYLRFGSNNLLAIRAADFGGLRYIDAKVTRQY